MHPISPNYACASPKILKRKDFSEQVSSLGVDTLVFVSSSFERFSQLYPDYCKAFKPYHQLVNGFCDSTSSNLVVNQELCPSKLIYNSTGAYFENISDVRSFRNATISALKHAYSSGAQNVSIACIHDARYEASLYVTASAAFDVNYLPPDVRTGSSDKRTNRFTSLSFICEDDGQTKEIQRAFSDNLGKIVMKDIGGGEPEQATPAHIQQYVLDLFKDKPVKIKVFDNQAIQTEFPLLAAVDRGNEKTDRHKGCVVQIEYVPPKDVKVEKTIFLVGKGITYDTGGVDLKVNGMRLMSYDKCGAGAVAGILKIISESKSVPIKVVGLMALTRNNIGPGAYVTDEIIQARSGQRVCIGNTDAEGRMAMADVLCYAKEMAITAIKPEIYTIATLTGHVGLVYGSGYAAILSNGPAVNLEIPYILHRLSFRLGDPIEISNLRKEDYDFVRYKGDRADLMQCNDKPSSRTSRGHNFPAAFLMYASGIIKHESQCRCELPYSHIDIASAVDSTDPEFMDHPNAAVISTLSRYILK